MPSTKTKDEPNLKNLPDGRFKCLHEDCENREPFKNEHGGNVHWVRAHTDAGKTWGKNGSRSKRSRVRGDQVVAMQKVLIRGLSSGNKSTSEMIDLLSKNGFGNQQANSLRSAVAAIARGTNKIVSAGRGMYSLPGTSLLAAPAVQTVPTPVESESQIEEESPERILMERDYYRQQCIRLQEISMSMLSGIVLS